MQSGVSDDEMEDESLYEGDSTSASAMLPICGSQAPLPFEFWLCFSHLIILLIAFHVCIWFLIDI
jgi:hypothetical protein